MGLSRTHTDAQTDGDQARIREKSRGEGKIRINGRDKSRKNIREKESEKSLFPFHIFDCVLFSPTCLCRAGGKEKSNEK